MTPLPVLRQVASVLTESARSDVVWALRKCADGAETAAQKALKCEHLTAPEKGLAEELLGQSRRFANLAGEIEEADGVALTLGEE